MRPAERVVIRVYREEWAVARDTGCGSVAEQAARATARRVGLPKDRVLDVVTRVPRSALRLQPRRGLSPADRPDPGKGS